MSTLREHTIRLAASYPHGSTERTALLQALAAGGIKFTGPQKGGDGSKYFYASIQKEATDLDARKVGIHQEGVSHPRFPEQGSTWMVMADVRHKAESFNVFIRGGLTLAEAKQAAAEWLQRTPFPTPRSMETADWKQRWQKERRAP